MARGHKAVIRRSITPAEWLRVRLAEVRPWRLIAAEPTGPWQARDAEWVGVGRRRFTGPWREVADGETWGGPDATVFFRADCRVGEALAGLAVDLELETPAEMIVRVDGRYADAFDPNRSRIPLARRARAGKSWRIEMEAYPRSAPDDMRVEGGSAWGWFQPWRPPRLAAYDPAVEAFLYDIQVPMDVAACDRVDPDLRDWLARHLDAAMKLVDRDTVDRRTLRRSLKAARHYLRETVYAAGHLAAPGRLALVGHAHVDVAYHWRVRQGVRKNARTTLVQLALMDRYPEMRYCHTQPYVYEQLKAHRPELFERVRRKVAAGQWELVGGPYVECDCNTPSPESLIRQCLLGKRFFLREFGLDVDTCWLPDVFGNSWAMPQVLARCGIRYFVSNKMSTWNDTNRFPHTNFRWRGADGTEVAACVPATHFISWLTPQQLLDNWDGFAEKTAVGESMNMFGFGDGGGGLTREMLETARRIRRFPGLPETRIATGKAYLDDAFATPEDLAVWDDELYLEMHRGVHTTKAELKRLNRRCELAARDAELLCCLAGENLAAARADELTGHWKTVLVNQFHDILPGSHTEPVARDAADSYAEALAGFESIRDAAARSLAREAKTDAQPGEPFVVVNTLAWQRRGTVELDTPAAGAVDAAGQPLPAQRIDDEGTERLLVGVPDVPAGGYATIHVRRDAGSPPDADADRLVATPTRLANAFFDVRLDELGQIARLTDRRHVREVLPAGERANRLELFEDKPGMYDAWDIVATFDEKQWPIDPPEELRVVESGPVRAAVAFERRFFDSRLVQHIRIWRDTPRIDFHTVVDWREHNRLLKVAFPVAVLARRATFDLGYGSITRPTHTNTSWDAAKFEVCGQKWADLSEAGYGASVLNDSKYGWDVRGRRIRLSLLRGSIRPDPDADIGTHRFTYSLFPHAGGWQDGGTVRAAYELNCPLLAANADRHDGAAARRSLVRVEADGVHLGALKWAADGGAAVVRLAEQHGGRERAVVEFAREVAGVRECDFIERPERALRPRKRGFSADMAPFQIRTFLVTFGT